MSFNIVVPEMGESIVEATVIRWLKKEGEQVKPGEAVVELETEKANFEVGAEQGGVLAQIKKKEEEDVKVGDILGVIDADGKSEKHTSSKEETKVLEQAEEEPMDITGETPKEKRESLRIVREEGKTKIKATPVARRLAEAHDIDMSNLTGTGPGNRITKEDVQSHIDNMESKTESVPAGKPEQTAVRQEKIQHAEQRERGEERVRMSRRRRTIARRMLEAQKTAAILTTFNEVDMSSVMQLRKRRKESFKERYGVGLGIVSFFVKASIGALREYPLLNAEIQGDEIVYKNYYDIGVAIGAAGGLVVPVLRNADKMSFAQAEKAIIEFAKNADENTLTIDDLRGGTFTISNGGVFGSLLSTPILNPPQVAILGLHKIEERPIVVNHEIVIRPMMYVALSYDHRIVDGREAVLCLVRIKNLIEDPGALLLEG